MMNRVNVMRRTAVTLALGLLLGAPGCEPRESFSDPVLDQGQVLRLDPEFDNPNEPGGPIEPAGDYTLFEADPVRPVAVLEKSGLVAVTNTFGDRLELLKPEGSGVRPCGAIQVGMRPVAVAVVSESRHRAELWVVNHVSDSISVAEIDLRTCKGEVVETLHTGDEPRDIVVTRNGSGQPRVFVATAHRGQHHPVESARLGRDLVRPPSEKDAPGLADVFVFDPRRLPAPIAVVNLFTEPARALALGKGVVYAAGFRTGNRTTVVSTERVAQRGIESVTALLARDAEGRFIEQDGELVLAPEARGRVRIQGGMPAVAGLGRCMPDPRPGLRDDFQQQLCVKTDSQHRVLGARVQAEGVVRPECQCTSGDGTLQPTAAVIVQFFESRKDCGDSFTTFPDGQRGCWLDASPSGVATPAAHADAQAPAMAWNDDVRFTLPDEDVFAIDVDSLAVVRSFSGIGTVLFGMAVQPNTGKLLVTNTEAKNLTRFEGAGSSSSTTVRGHLHESRITVIDPARNRVQPLHLNPHIDYSQCCERDPEKNQKSFAFPTAGVFSPDGERFYFSALGSDKIGVLEARALNRKIRGPVGRGGIQPDSIAIGTDAEDAAGPVGLTFDAHRGRLYVKTHFSNELLVVDPERSRVVDRVALTSPEPPSIREGRPILYDARRTSAHGDSACASCHVFGDFDGLAWDLGDPDAETVNNPGPLVVPTELVALAEIARDPFGREPQNRPPTPNFRSNKGPMSTQTLRGMANHGAQHWRGDRTRRFQTVTAQQPNFGSLNEDNSFGEFDVAIAGLNGNDTLLPPAVFQKFTNFALQLTLPPNPVRSLDDSLDREQARARALYFGCAEMSDEQYRARACVVEDGELVQLDQETRNCTCAKNPLIGILQNLPQIQGFGRLLQALFSNTALASAFDARLADATDLPEAAQAELGGLVDAFISARNQLLALDLALGPKSLLAEDAATALSRMSGALLRILELSSKHRTPNGRALLSLLAGSIPPEALAADSPLRTPEGLQASFGSTFALANLNLRVLADERARGTGEFHDILLGCDPGTVYACRLRVSDSFQTCHGCHTLDPAGNAEFDAYRPGFFGTNGGYSFENESQVFKIPHLRNLYQKAGMFGMPQVPFFLPESVLGANRGGFFAEESAFMGPQLRGFGFLHDGSTDTLHRFHGAAVFVARKVGALGNNDPGNPGGLEAFLPEQSLRPACVARFRESSPEELAKLDPTLGQVLGLCLQSSPVPDLCFLDPESEPCRQALAQIATQLGNPKFPDTFKNQILPACFQLGSTLEGGSPEGDCYPEGLRDREAMEAFMLAFDSNLKPMVGQQLTLRPGKKPAPALFSQLFQAAEQKHCDLALRQKNRGMLVTRPDGARPERSHVTDARGRQIRLSELKEDGPITLTCYPPQPEKAEARRSAFSDVR